MLHQNIDVAALSEDELRALHDDLEALAKAELYGQFYTYFPDTGPLARHLYPKHMEFFEATATHSEVLLLAANRIGKTMAGAYASTCWLTGDYPHWWNGRRWDHPIKMWAAGDTNETTRDVIQKKLLGGVEWHGEKKGVDGTGMIPRRFIDQDSISWKAGVPDLIDTLSIKHKLGGHSTLGLKAYAQGRRAFQGTEQDVIWCIVEGELVQMADGRLLPIEEVKAGNVVLSINDKGVIVERRVTQSIYRGAKECVRVIPKHGTTLKCTPDHDVYWGYRLASKVQAADATRIAQLRPGWWPAQTVDRDDAWYVWAGLVVSDGYIAGRKVTNGNVAAMERAIALLPSEARVRRKDFKDGHVPDWCLVWPEFWRSLKTALAHEKVIPNWVFTSSREKAALFLRWLYMGDGWAAGHSIGYATTSEKLANQVVILLNRLGVRARVNIRRSSRDSWRDQYWVLISRASEVLAFLDLIGIEAKEAAVAAVHAVAVRRAAVKASRGAHLHDPNRGPPKHKPREVRYKSARINAIEPIGERPVYDITVENEHRFLVGTNLVSNCDEEPDIDVYGEMLIRLMTTKGLGMLTFTPLSGYSDVVKAFLPAIGTD